MTSLIWPAAQNHTEAAAAASYRGWLTWQRRRRPCILHTMIQLVFFRVYFFVAFSCGAWRLRASSSPLSRQAGRHQRRRIMCNYNRQSKTKPFTFNEFLLEKGRLPQGGILMKQMAECSQGQTLTVLLFFFFFTVCQQFQHSEELHLSLDRSLRASGERMCLRDRLLLIDISHKMEGGGGNNE